MVTPRFTRWLWLAPALAATAACVPSAPCNLRACDIRESSCQVTAAHAAACLLGEPARAIPVALMTRDELTREAIAGLTEAEKLAETRRLAALALIDLADPGLGADDLARAETARVGAYYDSSDKRIVIVTDSTNRAEDARDRPWDMSLLVHEFTHALQDAAGRLAFPFADGDDSYDRYMARGALVEGEASLTETLTTLGLFEYDTAAVPWPRVFARLHDHSIGAASLAPAPVDLAYGYFVYPFGLSTVYRRFASGGTAALAALWAAPPVSAREVMLGIDPRDPIDGPLVEELGPVSVPRLPGDFRFIGGDRVGAFVFQLFVLRAERRFTSPYPPAVTWAAAFASELRGDYLSLFHSTGPFACWRLRFASGNTAYQVGTYLERFGRQVFEVSTIGRDVVITAQARTVPRPAISGWSLPPKPPPETPPTAPWRRPGALIAKCPRHAPLLER